MNLDTATTYLKGVGPQRAEIFRSKGLLTVEDLLYYLPFRYEDRSNTKAIAKLAPGETATVVGEISAAHLFRAAPCDYSKCGSKRKEEKGAA